MRSLGTPASRPVGAQTQSRFFAHCNVPDACVVDIARLLADVRRQRLAEARALADAAGHLPPPPPSSAETSLLRSASRCAASIRSATTSSLPLAVHASRADDEGASSEPEEDVCAICLEPPSHAAQLQGCSHTFCVRCIERWVAQCSKCPLCKREVGAFSYRERAGPGARGAWRRVRVPPRELVQSPAAGDTGAGFGLEGETGESEDDFYYDCQICGSGDLPDEIILCDGGCDGGYHLLCLSPPLAEVPEGHWLCPSCAELHATAFGTAPSPARHRAQGGGEVSCLGELSCLRAPRSRDSPRARNSPARAEPGGEARRGPSLPAGAAGAAAERSERGERSDKSD
ncbi:hypothetical protein T492DRAFT_986739, partial [Pavlovales sp. CCMP2436]